MSLPCPELAESLSDGHCLDPTSQQFIEQWGSCGDLDHIFSLDGHLISRHEAVVFYLPDHLQDFIDFSLIDSFDICELFLGSHDDARDGAKTTGFKFGDIRSIDPIFLKLLNLVEVSLLQIGLLDLLLLLHFDLLPLGGLLALLLHALIFLLYNKCALLNT